MAKTPEIYILIRDAPEAERLEMQHRLYLQAQGYHAHPDIPLQEDARVAELATGTSIWLREFAVTHPSAECHGFDLVNTMFPSELPSNVQLHTADLKQPFDSRWLGYFDFVHIRFIQAALKQEDWALVLKNILTLLKPGGWLQWGEVDSHGSLKSSLRPPAPASTSIAPYYNTLGKVHRPPRFSAFRETTKYIFTPQSLAGMCWGFDHLEELFQDPEVGNLENIFVDFYETGLNEESRKQAAYMAVNGMASIARGYAQAGKDFIDFDEWQPRALQEIENGFYINFKMGNFIGRKKMQS